RSFPTRRSSDLIGQIGEHERVAERRIEMVVPPQLRDHVTAVLREVHPYEEPAFSFLATRAPSAPTGSGRIGQLAEEMTLREFAGQVAATLPATAQGIRVSGDLDPWRTRSQCAGEPAMRTWGPRTPPGRTCTSPPICAITALRRPAPNWGHRPSPTPRTGPASGRGSRSPPAAWIPIRQGGGRPAPAHATPTRG